VVRRGAHRRWPATVRLSSPVGAAAFLIDGGSRWPTVAARGPTAPGDRGGSEGHEELVGNAAGATLIG
jgi:hypothetical protein